MARTTLDLDRSILTELRQRGAAEHKSMGQVASELLAVAISTTSKLKTGNEPLNWVSSDLGIPRVDLEDKDALHAVLDESP